MNYLQSSPRFPPHPQSGQTALALTVRVIACIEDPVLIEKILTYLDAKGAECEATWRPPVRTPPQRGLFDKTG